jgi:glycosyltransferase involved in cell wall biosynthesis
MCRLERWKRVDRSLQIVAGLVRGGRANYIYLVGGDGVERGALEHLASDLGISPFVVFLGAVPHSEVAGYIALADFFLSMNDLSNVGNPLLEAIRARRIIVTVATGDTTRWIVHRHNGLIYEPDEMLASKAVADIQELVSHASRREELLQNLLRTERERLWGWEERLSKEVDTVQALLAIEN